MAGLNFNSQARDWISAWNAHDLERILSHYSEDVELSSPFVARLAGKPDGWIRGKAALREYFAQGLKAYPKLRFDLLRLYPGNRSCVLEYRSVENLHAAEVLEFDELGKIKRVLSHYDADADQGAGETGPAGEAKLVPFE